MQQTTENVINLLMAAKFALQQCELKGGGTADDSNDSIEDAFSELFEAIDAVAIQCEEALA